MNIDYVKVGREIADRRRLLNLTQADLSERAGISIRRLTEIENGKVANISLNTMFQLSQGLFCSLNDLVNIGGDENGESDDKKLRESKNLLGRLNYTSPYPYYDISTFAQLFLILPVLDEEFLYDSLERVEGDIFSREEYMSQQIDTCFRLSKDTKAKRYVDAMLSLIRSKPWEGQEELTSGEALKSAYEEKLKTDPYFKECHEEYRNMIKMKKLMNNLLKETMLLYNSYLCADSKNDL